MLRNALGQIGIRVEATGKDEKIKIFDFKNIDQNRNELLEEERKVKLIELSLKKFDRQSPNQELSKRVTSLRCLERMKIIDKHRGTSTKSS